ncbi:MAG: rod shape-determining protein MreC [Patescibacteria group bacterium]|jgi:rod shape-determining protein MreC
MFKFLRQSRLSLILLAVAVLLIFLHYSGVVRPIENLAIKVFSPVQSRVYSLGVKINNIYSNLSVNKDLAGENRRLNEEVNQLTVANSQLKTQLQEFQEFKVQQDFVASAGLGAIAAKVIGKNLEPNSQSIILNKGSDDGIRVDFPLITADGVIVGKISRVKASSAEAILINDSRSRIAVLVQNEANSQGVVVGEHGLSLRIELIPPNDLIKEDDMVVTSGLEPTIPRGLVVGKISRILSEPNSFFQTAAIRPQVKIDSLTVVTVLISPDYD